MRHGIGVVALACTFAAAAGAAVAATAQRRPNFVADVAPILHANCASCHQPEGPAPFALLSYDDARAKGKEIRAAVTSRQMPPWSTVAASSFPALLHDRRLNARQIGTIAAWVDADMPAGDLARMPMPPTFPAGWQLGIPDVILALPRPVPMPAGDTAVAVNLTSYLNFPEDRWIKAVDFRPSTRGVVSHALFFAVPAQMTIGPADELPGFTGLLGAAPGTSPGELLAAVNRSLQPLAVWAPAMRLAAPPQGTAFKLPKGSSLVMQLHAEPRETGAIEDGSIAIYFEKPAPSTPLVSLQVPPLLGFAAGIDIPAGDAVTVVRDEFVLPIDVTVFGARGYAHHLGKDLKLTARLPDGTIRGLLWIDRWQVKWRETYFFASPVRLPKGTRVAVEITYAPSERHVLWGPRLSDETGAMDLVIAEPSPEAAAMLTVAREAHLREQMLKARGRSAAHPRQR